MATPDYLNQAVLPGRSWTETDGSSSVRAGAFHRPSVNSLIWAVLDFATVAIAMLVALRVRDTVPGGMHIIWQPAYLLHVASLYMLGFIGWYGVLLIVIARSYGLYEPILERSGLHEQRLAVQASLTSGLLLCGSLYLARAVVVSRIVVVLTVIFTTVLLCIRRAIWRSMVYRRYREGLETRNVLIVGSGRVAHALRNHLESLRHLGFRFKGFVSLSGQEAESGDADVIGDVRNCLSLARSLFVDEIFFSEPAEKQLVIGIVEEARGYGIDVRVVPDLYDGLAWAAPVEYIGQFPTIPLHRRDLPIGAYLLKRALDVDVDLGGEPPPTVLDALLDDLNTPRAMAELFALAKTLETSEDASERQAAKSALLGAGRLLGFLQQDPIAWFEGGADAGLKAKVEALLVERFAARQAKDWATADRIRDELNALNVVVMDNAEGATWRLKDGETK